MEKEELENKIRILEYKIEELERKLSKHTERWSCHELG